ncbi:DNA glycosylase [Hypoxylon sp. FL1857]|nr:DNA glycosylase [Hypoxylon sp. FL1857]
MDPMVWDYLAEAGDTPKNKLANDLLFGFEAKNDFQQWYIGDIITNSHVPEDEMKELTHLSLLRGFEEFQQMICCAKSMREKASFDNPLDGQDLLTFITKIITPPSGSLNQDNEKHLPMNQPKDNVAFTEPESVQLVTDMQQTDRKRKRSESRVKTDPDEPLRKRVKDEQSPFWSIPDADSSEDETERKRLKRGKRKAKKTEKKRVVKRELRAKKAAKRRDSGSLATDVLTNDPNWCEARGTRRSSNATTPAPVPASTQESVSGPDFLRDNDSLHAATDSETGGLVKGLQSSSGAPHNTELTSSPATPSPDVSDKDHGLERHETTSDRPDNGCPPSQVQSQTPRRKAKSHYFATPDAGSPPKAKALRPPRGTIPCIPFPRLNAPKFGLIQEELATDPFRLLVAVTFLIRVKGKHAIPVFHDLMDRYPTPRDLAEADANDIVATIRHLGLSAVRAAKIQKYARIWLENPPRADVRYGVKNYPTPGDGADIHAGEVLGPDDPRASAWEIGHMTQGRYAIDSWRIFCRDVLLGRAEDWRGKGREGEFQPEWMRVLPEDKELRACLRWLWMQEGWAWDPRTGEREVLSEDMRRAVDEGRVAYDDAGELEILEIPPEEGVS